MKEKTFDITNFKNGKKTETPTASTADLGNQLNGHCFCILDDLANPKNGLNFVSNQL